MDIGKNSFHIVGHDQRGAIVLRQKWSRPQRARSCMPPRTRQRQARGHAAAHRAWGDQGKGWRRPQPTSVLVVFVFPVADLTANLSRRESIRVDVYIDRVALHGGEQRVESGLTPGESLTGERQNHRGRDASSYGSR